MQLNVPPDVETLINKRLSGGGYANAEDVLRRTLEAQDAEERRLALVRTMSVYVLTPLAKADIFNQHHKTRWRA